MKKLLNKFVIKTMPRKELDKIAKQSSFDTKEKIEKLAIESAMNHGEPDKFMFVGEKGRKAFLRLLKELKK